MEDIILDNTGDLKIQSGDMLTGSSDFQHIADVIESAPGEFKLDLFAGVGSTRYLSGKSNDLERAIKLQMKRLGYRPSDLIVDKTETGTFKVYTNAERN